jgi:hypothetical protein
MVLCAMLGACASKPPAQHRWIVGARTNHIPLQGLPAAFHVVVDERSLRLANFTNEAERDEARRSAMAAGAAGGAAYAGVATLAEVAPLCIVLPPLCVGVVAAGGAIGASASAVTSVAPAEAAQLGALFERHATSAALGKLAAARISNSHAGEYPRVVVRLVAAVLVPTREGVSFRLVAEAQGFPDEKRMWQPSVHFVPFPSRPIKDWLGADGYVLQRDLGTALRVLAASIVPAYQPYDQRR